MANRTYSVSKADLQHVRFYLGAKVQSRLFLSHLSEKKSDKALGEFYAIKSPESADEWIHTYLTPEQIAKLLTALRQRRRRSKHWDQTCTVTISTRAYEILKKLSKRDNVTYSATIETRLGKLFRIR